VTLEEQIASTQNRLDRLDQQIENIELKLEYPAVSMARASGRQIILGTLREEWERKRERLYHQRDKYRQKLARLIRKAEQPAISPTKDERAASKGMARGHSARTTPDVAKRRAIVKLNPEVPVQGLCRLFDHDRVPLPKAWLVPSWERAYKNSNYRKRIQVIVSHDKDQGT